MQSKEVLSLACCVAVSCGLAMAADTNGTQAKIGSSRAAAEMLQDTNQARMAIQQNNKQQALADVNRALDCASRLQQTGPHASNMIPIYTEWDEQSIIAPITAQQRKNGKTLTAQNQRQGNTGSANREATTPAERAAVRDVEAGFTSVAVDAKMAEEHLSAARTALQNGKTHEADAALAAVQDGVVLVSFDADMPLLKTRENLALASQEAQNGHYREASAALQAACNGLKEYSNTSGTNANQAKQLEQQISSYSKNLASDHANAESRIQDWWNQVTAWTKPAASTTTSRR